MNQVVRTGAKFFVYGSLTQGEIHFAKIAPFVRSVVPSKIKATAYRLKVGFPVVVEGGVDFIPGELVTLDLGEAGYEPLDAFHSFQSDMLEKCLYWRKEVAVQVAAPSSGREPMDDGAVLNERAWVYYLNPRFLPKNAKPLENGDWKSNAEPTLIEQLTSSQKDYIRRLGACLGREVIPIHLPIYRELMKLEIIVDKGRRLALSKLGHEVYRYLS